MPPGRGVTDTIITDNSPRARCDALPGVVPLNPPNRVNHPHFTSKLRLREVNRVTDSNFLELFLFLQLKIPRHRNPSVSGKLEHLVTCGVSSPPKELDPRDSSPDLTPGLRLPRCAVPQGKQINPQGINKYTDKQVRVEWEVGWRWVGTEEGQL